MEKRREKGDRKGKLLTILTKVSRCKIFSLVSIIRKRFIVVKY